MRAAQPSRSEVDLWENQARPKGAGNTLRPLTHSLDLTKEGMGVEPTLKICPACDRVRPVADFEYKSHGKTRLYRKCKPCIAEKREAANKVTLARRGAPIGRPFRPLEGGMTGAQRRAYWADFKRKKGCADCGSTDWRALEFDHLPWFTKAFTIGQAVPMTRTYSDAAIAAEVAKCDVVCRKCHLRRTLSRKRYGDEEKP